MASPLEGQLILCDAAVAEPTTGKLHMLGAGWSQTTSPTAPSAVAVLLKIPWDRTNQPMKLALFLVTEDGRGVTIPTDQGDQEIRNETEIEVGRPPGLPAGTPLDASLAFPIPPLPLTPGRYEWHLEIAGLELRQGFLVRSANA